MDIAEIDIKIPSLTLLNEQIIELIKEQVTTAVSRVLDQIAELERLPRDGLNHYVDNLDFSNIDKSLSQSRKLRREVESSQRCRAKTSRGVRCTRKKKDEMYCGSHIHTRPYGELEGHTD